MTNKGAEVMKIEIEEGDGIWFARGPFGAITGRSREALRENLKEALGHMVDLAFDRPTREPKS